MDPKETEVVQANDLELTKELHLVRAHLHHYASLLEDFQKSIVFVLETTNPSLSNHELYTLDERKKSEEVMQRECNHLLNEIRRLDHSRIMQDRRVQNAMDLVRTIVFRSMFLALLICNPTCQGYQTVNFDDSRQMQKLTEAALKDSAGEDLRFDSKLV